MIFLLDGLKAVMLLSFPFLFYSSIENLSKKKDWSILLRVSLLASCLCFFGNSSFLFAIWIHIPLFIAYLKKYRETYVILNLLLLFYFYAIIHLPMDFLVIEYVTLFLVLYFCRSKTNFFLLVTTYFASFSLYYYQGISLWSRETFCFLVSLSLYYLLLSFFRVLLSSKSKYVELEETYRGYLFKFIHEVKNPIAVCKGYLEMIHKTKEIPASIEKYLEIVDKEMNESLNLMEDYLLFGRFNVELDYMDINLLLEEVYEKFKNLEELENVELHFDYNEEEFIILGDYNKLKQVFVNLIKNAIEAKKEEKTLHIHLKISTKKEKVQILLEDDGIGIEDLNRVGTEFYTTKAHGTGLGISFSKTILSLHHGDIKYASKYQQGTKVTIHLPLVEA